MDYDVLIIGSGPAGQHAAWQAVHMGKRAAIIERKPKIGGAGSKYQHGRTGGTGAMMALGTVREAA